MHDSGTSNPESLMDNQKNLRPIVLILYLLFIAGMFSATLSVMIAILIAYIKRDDAQGTIYQSHIDQFLKVCWTTMLVVPVLGLCVAYLFFIAYASGLNWIALLVFAIAIFVLICVTIWSIYHIANGFWCWTELRAVG